jgi:hypothetical protein
LIAIFFSLVAASIATMYMTMHNTLTFYTTKVDSDAKYCTFYVQSIISIRIVQCSIWIIEVVSKIGI